MNTTTQDDRRTTLFASDTDGLRGISGLSTETALRRAVRFLEGLTRTRSFLEDEIPALLEEAEEAEGWYVARRYETDEYSLQVFVWPAGTGTKIHDHSSWGVYRCVAGAVVEHRYERLDDGSTPDHARLDRAWSLGWCPQDGCSTVLPGDGGIHSVTNPFERTAVSVHLYGPKTGEVEGRDYDPSRDHVCDRIGD